MEFADLPVPSLRVWEHLLDEKRSDWRIVRLKPVNINAPGQFMIVSEDHKVPFHQVVLQTRFRRVGRVWLKVCFEQLDNAFIGLFWTGL